MREIAYAKTLFGCLEGRERTLEGGEDREIKIKISNYLR